MYLREKPIEEWHGRSKWFGKSNLDEIINTFSPILNEKASTRDPFGVVRYPK